MRVYKSQPEEGVRISTHGLVGLSSIFFVRDSLDELAHRLKGLDFRVRSNDYFVNLATVLDLMRQVIAGKSKQHYSRTRQLRQLKKLRNDLLYLQRHYRVVKK